MSLADPLPLFDLGTVLREGDVVAWPQGTGEPLGLTRQLTTRRHDLPRLALFIGMSTSDTLTPQHADRFVMRGLNGAGSNRRLTSAGVLDVMPVHVSQVPRLLRDGAIKVDVALIRVRPADQAGFVSVGVVADYTRALIDAARLVVAEVDERMPLTGQDALVPVDAIHHFVAAPADQMLLTDPEPEAVDRLIADRVAGLVPDRATVQLGIGGLPVAVARALARHRGLGIHTGSVSDALVDLVEAGVVTNAHKGIDPGVSVVGCLFGSARLNGFADRQPALSMRSADYTHAAGVLARVARLFSVNSAIEVDLTGQVNAEQAKQRYLGAVGGQVDFVRGAQASAGGRSIIALPAMTADGKTSRIVASLGGAVTTPRSDVDLIVTEFGIAELRGQSLSERARRLAAIAHPDVRDALRPDRVAVAMAPSRLHAKTA